MSQGSKRQMLYRERRRRRLRCVQIEIRDSEIEELINRGMLHRSVALSTSDIREALHKFLDQTLGHRGIGTVLNHG